MLDINLFRKDKGGNPELVRESEKRRYAKEDLVSVIMDKDEEWRTLRGELDFLNKYKRLASKVYGKLLGQMKKNKQEIPEVDDTPLPESLTKDLTKTFADKANYETLDFLSLKKLIAFIDSEQKRTTESISVAETTRDNTLKKIGNIVHETCVVHNNEDFNGVEKEWGTPKTKEDAPFNHVDLMTAIGGVDLDAGALVSGSRGYFLMGSLVRLNQALIAYGMDFLEKKGYVPVQTPFFMNKEIMQCVAQLEQFDEELYHVSEGDDKDVKYLIATSEQPICALNMNKWITEEQLPIKYVGISTCFRKEAGSHGRDTAGIFRVHQFEKIEQFVITSPRDNISWKMQEEMLKNSEDFYQSLEIPYRVVNIVSGKLNNAAAKKLDLEAWFPNSQTYRELVSCSNCTDYQSRRLNIRFGVPGKNKQQDNGLEKEYVHMLNSTLTATSRTLCCILENNQTDEGIVVPKILRNYMGGLEMIKYVRQPVDGSQQQKKK
uniref:serine--tRNA ligase n=1 Tax=Percolomonas cosmopolitus TaxID=63605 RepID=A0A7S1KQS8_9EUKA|mmetsp:Transcript_3358/g.12760  ORF Transcript_3358/g.12760 Transcript_3358/m.12760 type:complete len:490 (+) Transcript_3358:80-1549(+)